jgi:DNA-binding LacI/PurR family transcriptional regulator
MVANLKDFARRAGVSVATASPVLSSSRYPVSDEARRRVEASATELSHVPSAQAQGLLFDDAFISDHADRWRS